MPFRSQVLAILVFFASLLWLSSAPFVPAITSFTQLSNSVAAWGDYDNDGRLDLLIAGNNGSARVTQLWRNTGTGFESVNPGLPGVDFGALAWGDYDNDGRLDILLTGNTGAGRIAQIWRNNGSGFTLFYTNLPGVDHGSVAWGDFNNDGKIDFVLTGQTGSAASSGIAGIWQNIGGSFTNLNSGLPGLALSSVAWGDYNSDGRLDLLFSGISTVSGGPVVRIWRNTGTGFVDSALFTFSQYGAVAWADFDADGKLDVVARSRIYRNNSFGSSFFLGLPALTNGTAGWGDFDNDGYPDLLITGTTGTTRVSQIWQRTALSFSNINFSLPGVDNGSAIWGDYDGDGRLDFVLVGGTDSNAVAQLYQNVSPATNSPPQAPSALQAQVNGYEVRLSWNPSTDLETPSAGLSYNLRMGTTPGGVDIVSPNSLSTGKRLIPALGNRQQTLSATMTNLLPGVYYWSVQAIDAAFAGSSFAAESSFEIVALPPDAATLPVANLVATNATLQATVNPNGASSFAYFEYGTTTNYGNVTTITNIGSGYDFAAVTAQIGLTVAYSYHYRVVSWNAHGTNFGTNVSFIAPSFADAGVGLTGVRWTSVAWGDYDADGKLDLLVAGIAPTGRLTQVWRNTGSGFTNIQAGLPGVESGTVAWGDYDNDGRLDILITGTADSGGIAQVWRNTSLGFSNINAGLTGVDSGSGAWGDYDNDGWQDILLAGQAGASHTNVTEIWHNEGGRRFTRINSSFPGVAFGLSRWIDYDNDGWLDVALIGYLQNQTALVMQLWRNTGNTFSNADVGIQQVFYQRMAFADYDNDGLLDISISPAQLWHHVSNGFVSIPTGLGIWSGGFSAWGDYDNDGYLDLLVTGDYPDPFYARRKSELFRIIDGSLVDMNVGLPGIAAGSVAWGDYDNDGRLDLVLAGHSGYGPSTPLAQVWRNLLPSTNTIPLPPSNLTSQVSPAGVVLNWDSGSDFETPSSGLSYNLRVGTAPGGIDIVSPEATSSGFRLVPEMGNRQMARLAILKNLPPARYYWSIQSIDTSFAGSAFAAERTFVVPPRIVRLDFASPGHSTMQFFGRAGQAYILQFSTDLQSWDDVKDLTAGSDGNFTDSEVRSSDPGGVFYRLQEK